MFKAIKHWWYGTTIIQVATIVGNGTNRVSQISISSGRDTVIVTKETKNES